jgi:hypothetical protein
MSFSLSANNSQIKEGHLHAHVRRIDGSWNEDAKLNLDHHIGNNNGVLEWGGQNFSQSVQNVHLRDGHILEADARRVDGSWNRTSINLNEKIGNNNGELVHG